MKIDKWNLAASWILIFLLGYFVALGVPNNINTYTPFESANITVASSKIVAVSEGGGRGSIGSVNVEISPGNGKTLVETNPFIEPDTQLSASTSKRVAEMYTGKSLVNHNIIYSFDISGTVIGGPSAGASMTAATIAAIEGRDINQNAVITGTINPDGSIGRVGSIFEKASAAGESGMNKFLVPKGQETLIRYKEEIKREEVAPGFIIRRVHYIPEEISLNNYTMRKYGMRTIEVEDIEEALSFLTGE